MIDIKAASQLLDMNARMNSPKRADEQLEGAVALYNILTEHGVAYLADEVGMGKTYVALGALALFRHFNPSFRVLVIAPRENIQLKWMKEMRNFVANNVRFADLRVKAVDGTPARPLVACGNLLDLVHHTGINPNQDFFVRLSSFSLPVAGKSTPDKEAIHKLRNSIRRTLPWLSHDVFNLHNKVAFKDNYARAVCCALPVFDLVIVDEGHNLKHGFADHSSSRNRVLSLAFGHPDGKADAKLFPHYGPRAKRVLFLSATPIEETFEQLWNQLNIFGKGAHFTDLRCKDIDDELKKTIAAKFLLRRVTSVQIGENVYTKNLYRREWRQGGVHEHDKPIRIEDDRQQLIVALIQKKVSELLGHEKFKSCFQIGMLASFESFLETSKVKRGDDEENTFDHIDQTDDQLERDGIDVAAVNNIARNYRETFKREMPHPKMDALVVALADSWRRGEKSLVFVRRVASVKELKRKLDESYDSWLIQRLRQQLPVEVQPRFADVIERYQREKRVALANNAETSEQPDANKDEADHGGIDTFFAWYFRGDGPSGIISGANIQRRFIQQGAVYATFFEDNYVADVLRCRPGHVEENLASVLGVERTRLRQELRNLSRRFLPRVQKLTRIDRYEAVQAAAIELLHKQSGPLQERAGIIWRERFQIDQVSPATDAPDIGDWLELKTFFTEIREQPKLRAALWPVSTEETALRVFREQELRRQLLAAAARLGHAFIDLYIMTIQRLRSIDLRAQEISDDDAASLEVERIQEYINLLEVQRTTSYPAREWGAYDELADIAANFSLIIDVNAPDAWTKQLGQTTKLFGQLMRQQQPIGGMSGKVNRTLVQQFRMPGYPLVLISTDLLQEGEDLHTFCSAVHHYGISWTPSSMEQRTGRIDRVRSQTDRRLSQLTGGLTGDDQLQVYFPHLTDTLEVLQVQRVLERMNTFLRLMHEGLGTTGPEDKRIDASREFLGGRKSVPQIKDLLRSAFPVQESHVKGDVLDLVVPTDHGQKIEQEFRLMAAAPLPGISIAWEPVQTPGKLIGTAILGDRKQPFTLLLRSYQHRLLVRCISPVGCIDLQAHQDALMTNVSRLRAIVVAVAVGENRSYNLTVEGDVLLGADSDINRARASALIQRVVRQADNLEQIYLPGADSEVGLFRDALLKESLHGN